MSPAHEAMKVVQLAYQDGFFDDAWPTTWNRDARRYAEQRFLERIKDLLCGEFAVNVEVTLEPTIYNENSYMGAVRREVRYVGGILVFRDAYPHAGAPPAFFRVTFPYPGEF